LINVPGASFSRAQGALQRDTLARVHTPTIDQPLLINATVSRGLPQRSRRNLESAEFSAVVVRGIFFAAFFCGRVAAILAAIVGAISSAFLRHFALAICAHVFESIPKEYLLVFLHNMGRVFYRYFLLVV
jgi:hypothetical protein